jgi:hypothetical protein
MKADRMIGKETLNHSSTEHSLAPGCQEPTAMIYARLPHRLAFQSGLCLFDTPRSAKSE